MTFKKWYESLPEIVSNDVSYLSALFAWIECKAIHGNKWISVNERLPESEGFYPVKTDALSTFERGYFDFSMRKFDMLRKSGHNPKSVCYWLEIPR